MAGKKLGRPVGSKNRLKPLRTSGPKQRQRTIARVKPNATLVFDPALRDSKGHLKKSVIDGLDRLEMQAEARSIVLVNVDNEYMTDTEYVNSLNNENEKVDETWWAIPAKDRPPLSEYLREKGLIP